MDEVRTHVLLRCFQCKGPWHDATGHYDRRNGVAFCGACYRPFVQFVKNRMSMKGKQAGFYEAAATSIHGRVPASTETGVPSFDGEAPGSYPGELGSTPRGPTKENIGV